MTQDEIKQAWEDATGSCWPDEGCFTAGEYDHHILAFAQLVRSGIEGYYEDLLFHVEDAMRNEPQPYEVERAVERIRSMKK